MLDLADLTSPVRVALAGAIVTHCRNHGTPETRAKLARDITLQPFEDMTHDQIIDLAYAYGVTEEEVSRIVTRHDHTLTPLPAVHLCGTCHDERVVRVEVNGVERWARCPACNQPPPAAEPFDPKAKKR